jgi:hypothetical protein
VTLADRNRSQVARTSRCGERIRDMGLEWLLCPSTPRFLGYMKHATSTQWLANPNQGHSRFPRTHWSMYELSCSLSKVEIFCAHDQVVI